VGSRRCAQCANRHSLRCREARARVIVLARGARRSLLASVPRCTSAYGYPVRPAGGHPRPPCGRTTRDGRPRHRRSHQAAHSTPLTRWGLIHENRAPIGGLGRKPHLPCVVRMMQSVAGGRSPGALSRGPPSRVVRPRIGHVCPTAGRTGYPQADAIRGAEARRPPPGAPKLVRYASPRRPACNPNV